MGWPCFRIASPSPSAARGAPRLLDLATGKERRGADATKGLIPAGVAPAGKQLLAWNAYQAGLTCTVLDVPQLTAAREFTAPGKAGEIVTAALAPDGKTFAALAIYWRHGPMYRVPVGHRLSLWDVATGQERHLAEFRPAPGKGIFTGQPWALAFLDGGRTLVSVVQGGPDNGLMQFWDTATLKERRRFRLPLPEGHVVAFSADGTRFASSDRKAVCVWRTSDGRQLQRFAGHRRAVTALAFSPDGRVLASGSADTTILVWEVIGLRECPLVAPRRWEPCRQAPAREKVGVLGVLGVLAQSAGDSRRPAVPAAALRPPLPATVISPRRAQRGRFSCRFLRSPRQHAAEEDQ